MSCILLKNKLWLSAHICDFLTGVGGIATAVGPRSFFFVLLRKNRKSITPNYPRFSPCLPTHAGARCLGTFLDSVITPTLGFRGKGIRGRMEKKRVLWWSITYIERFVLKIISLISYISWPRPLSHFTSIACAPSDGCFYTMLFLLALVLFLPAS